MFLIAAYGRYNRPYVWVSVPAKQYSCTLATVCQCNVLKIRLVLAIHICELVSL